jgi:hypothetical protein
MSVRLRLQKLERTIEGPEPLIVDFRTFYDDDDGSVSSVVRNAVIIFAPGRCTNLSADDGESEDGFTAQVQATADRGPP